jgi:hypothetical protein
MTIGLVRREQDFRAIDTGAVVFSRSLHDSIDSHASHISSYSNLETTART